MTSTGGAPRGTVAFSSDSPGNFSRARCTLTGRPPTTSCRVGYTPAAAGTGAQTLTATYGGDGTHGPAQAGETETVISRLVARSFTDTTNGIHLGLDFDYSPSIDAKSLKANVNYIFGGFFVNYNIDFDPRVRHIDGYLDFANDSYPQNVPGHSLSDWQASHPDWIVYQCDGKTPAYYGTGNTNVPLDFSNPAVRAYEVQEAGTLFSQGAQGVAYDNFTFANYEDRCGVYRNGVWTPLNYAGRWQDNAQLDSDMMGWLEDMRYSLGTQYPGKTFTLNYTSRLNTVAHLHEITPYIDMDFDEGGFTHYGDQNLSGSAWWQEVNALEYLNQHGKAWDIDGAGSAPNDQSVTHAEINWALSNYLLVRGPHSYTYIYAANGAGYTGSPSGYGTFYNRPEYHVPIGHPTSARYQDHGVQMRNYSGGMTIVNPSSTSSYTVKLGQPRRDMYGTIYRSVTLGPTSGIVLLNKGG